MDEQLNHPELVERIAAWYPGRVAILTQLRAESKVDDKAVPLLLRTVKELNFVTINVKHFWRVVLPDSRFAIVSIDLPVERPLEISDWLRKFFKKPPFHTKAGRMGVVALLRPTRIEFYRVNQNIETLKW